MRRWIAEHRKSLAIALLGVLEVAAYIVADPGELPKWVVTVAAVINVLGVYLAPRNAPPVRSRKELADRVTRVRERDTPPFDA
jgi:hypothetical protein